MGEPETRSTSPKEIQFSEVIDVADNGRTTDVLTDGTFKSLLISASTVANLDKWGFKRPSPVQLNAIPPGLAGFDMLVQAKSGTGKTLVFSILTVENLNVQSSVVQKMIVAPTREIASQINETLQKLAPARTKTAVLTGGTSVQEDREKLRKGVHIVVGTTGRICQLVSEGSLNLKYLSLFVLDEADKMLTESFEKDVNYIFSSLPYSKQVAVFSATYPPEMARSLCQFLRSPVHIRLNCDDVQLIGIKQFVSHCLGGDAVQVAINALSSVQFKQALVFCNKADDCNAVVSRIGEAGFDVACISAKLEQKEREDVMKRLKKNLIKILVSTDLTARGIDADNVDFVFNIEPPVEVETYLHRIGRAARYGGHGAAVTIITDKRLACRFNDIVNEGGIRCRLLPSKQSFHPQMTTNIEYYESLPLFNTHDLKMYELKKKGKESVKSPVLLTDDVIEAKDENVRPDFSTMLDQALSLQSSLVNAVEKKKKGEEPNKKFTFIPSRSKKTTKYYMRGEMMTIREALTVEEWHKYATSRWDLSEEPFSISSSSVKKTSSNKSKLSNPVQRQNEKKGGEIIEFTRKDMIAICKSITAKTWKEYAKKKWNLNEDPFVKHDYMRCSYADQLRIQRKKEKEMRDKIVSEREASRFRLLSMGPTPSTLSVCYNSFDELCLSLASETLSISGMTRRGGCVPMRRSPQEYTRIIMEQTHKVDSFSNQFDYILKRRLGSVKEVEGGRSGDEEEEEGRNEEEEEVEEEDEDNEEQEEKQERYTIEENLNDNLDGISQCERAYQNNADFGIVYSAYISTMFNPS